ncbi:hypothetical protein IV203_038332 [Nitzschia inconspicua]|uniref:Methyltransferase domain-containing protein n=1 Tax=Nitzschia inconspicua TaxID=303405 RepID=A0A9K3Q1T4_9STRA|nr:hypothetical protein IV203_038332 [Nitzschia inconspicua]
MKVTGYITRRRCIGKKLAFADIQIATNEDHDSDANRLDGGRNKTIQVVFHRGDPETDVWIDTLSSNIFPERNTALPYGGFVFLDLCDSSVEDRHGTKSYHVKSWEILQNPRDEAIDIARNIGTGGISCSKYLKSRGEAFLKFNPQVSKNQLNMKRTMKRTHVSTSRRQQTEFSHGDNRAKALRAKIFAAWLMETFGRDKLAANGGVLDVAGGKGKLSIELSLQGKIPATIVDPLVRKHGDKLEPRDAKRIQKAQAPHPTLLPKEFNGSTFLADCEHVVTESSILVGLHPDECTEDILDVALRYNKNVAVVPCCVFSGFFSLRALPNGKAIRTYEDFLEYLLLKDERLKWQDLGFEGRNIVIYLVS